METGLTASDVALLNGKNNDNDWTDGGFMWIFALLILFWGGNGMWGNRNVTNGEPVTEAGLCNAMNFNNLENAVGRLSDQNQQQTQLLGNGICNLGYEMQGNISQLGKEAALGQSGINQNIMSEGNTIQRQIAECCCDNRLATANLSAQMDRQTCDITSAIHAEGEATRALMQTNEIQALRDKVSSLEMDSRMYGVVRYPNGFVYNAGNSPFCGCNGCGV